MRILANLLTALVLASALGGAARAAVETAPVATASGQVAGRILPSGVANYLGLPYAAAPVGDLRWRPPQPILAWQGVYHADRLGPECIQPLRNHALNHYFGEEPTGEDCLYLNVWAPKGEPGQKAPVVVWVHGGGFTIGSSGMALYSGARLAEKGVVVVSFNYRLGALGFMAHPALSAESASGASGDYGLMDQIAALNWVKANIAAFGGDPDNVTLAGQSAGSISIGYLQLMPRARGLFQKAVMMSGPPAGFYPELSGADALASGEKIQKALGAKTLAEMRQAPADKILALQADCQLGCSGAIRVGPSVDGDLLPKTVADLEANGPANPVPTLTGYTHDESAGFIGKPATATEFQAAVRKVYGADADAVLKAYPVAADADVAAATSALARETGVQRVTRRWTAALYAAGERRIYLYEFARKHPYSPDAALLDQDPRTIGAYHTSDVPYWLRTQDALNLQHHSRDWTSFDRGLSETMASALVAFARSGDPTAPGLSWRAWTPKDESLVKFADPVSQERLSSARLNALDAVTPSPGAAAAPVAPRPRD